MAAMIFKRTFQMLIGFLRDEDRALIRKIVSERDDQFVPGRQGTGYDKLDVRSDPQLRDLIDRSLWALGYDAEQLHWDAWVLRYKEGASIPPHTDEAGVFGMRHHRLNAMVQAADLGGKLFMEKQGVAFPDGWALVFVPDVIEHAVTEVAEGTRLIWSVGCWKSMETVGFGDRNSPLTCIPE